MSQQHHLIALQTLRQVISVDGSISIVEIILSETSLYQDITAALKNEVVAYLSPGAPGYLEDIALAQLGLILEMLSTGITQSKLLSILFVKGCFLFTQLLALFCNLTNL